ncbi:MAG: hydrogenase maturation protease [Sporomusaceae bacterium]|nr:hydrogenase maturation protease [Sporomusaceae bacterium]
MKRVIIIGFGNVLMGDDGAGIRASHVLMEASLPANIEVIDGGVASFEILDGVRTADQIILIDALAAGGQPGEIYRLLSENLDNWKANQGLSLHEFTLIDSLRLAKVLGPMPPIIIYGIEPEDVSFRWGLTPAVEKALARLIPMIITSVTAEEPD